MPEISTHELNQLCVCAFRYALGRMTYITQDIAQLIQRRAHLVEPWVIESICRDIERAIYTNNYGMEMDKEIWEKLLGELRGKND